MYMKKNLLRYLSVFALLTVLVACEDDEDKIIDNLPPEDAVLYSFKPLQISQVTDVNGNTFIASGTLSVDADISSEAAEGFSSQVVIQIVKIENGEEIEITKGAAFTLSGNGTGDVKTFNLNFDNIIEDKGEVNIAANLLEASTNRKIKGEGILISAETSADDVLIPYKIKLIDWSTDIDNNGDGFFSRRDVTFIVATEGNTETTLTGDVFLINDTSKDTVLIFQTGQFLVKREGFSTVENSFSLNMNNTLIRSGYEILMEFQEVGNDAGVIYSEIFKAADLVRIGFEPTIYDDRVYESNGAPVVSLNNVDTSGFYDSVFISFQMIANADLDYFDLDSTGQPFDLRAPYVRLKYFRQDDPDFPTFLTLADSSLSSDPVNAQQVGFLVSDLIIIKAAHTYDFEIQIMEPSNNYFNSTEDVPVITYTKADFPSLGDIKIDPK
jgi:hypothetical protein